MPFLSRALNWHLSSDIDYLCKLGPVLVLFLIQKKLSAICKQYSQSYTEGHLLGIFHLRSENFLQHLLFADDQNSFKVSQRRSEQLSNEFLAYLSLLPKPRQCCCHFTPEYAGHTWKILKIHVSPRQHLRIFKVNQTM